MQTVYEIIAKRAQELLGGGEVSRVLGWDADGAPTFFESEAELRNLRYAANCQANLSKLLLTAGALEGRTLAILKPCDAPGFLRLVADHRIARESVYALGVPCPGMNSTKCEHCGQNETPGMDESIPSPFEPRSWDGRYDQLKSIEALDSGDRLAFWSEQISRCIRCNACRNACPACSCHLCVFDNPQSGFAGKANTDRAEGSFFHIIRAYHVAGKCTDCGECARACPQNIPLHLLNRRLIADFAALYGSDENALTQYHPGDLDPGEAMDERGRGLC